MTSQPNTPPGTPGAGGVAAVLEGLRAQVAELAETLWAARTPEELMDGVAAAESLKTSIDGLVLAMVGELHATSGVKPCGWASTQDFVTATSGGHKSEGPAVVKLATVVEEPLMVPVGEAIRDGWLSTTKAQVITRAIDLLPGDPTIRARGVRFLLTEAARLDATELRKVVRHLVGVVDPDGQARRDEKELERGERAAHLDRDLVIKDDGAGGAFIRGRCSSEDATDLRTALMSLAAPVPSDGPTCDPGSCAIPGCSHNGRDPRDHGARMLDAFVELCRRARTADLLPTSHGTVPRVTVTMDFDHLRRATGYGTTETDEVLSPATIRRLACDAEIVPVILGSESQVLDIGRTSRLVTASLWTALVARDRHCRFPHCTRPPVMTHAHHIVHWADGGDTSLENLMLLCGHHHRLVHAGPWTIRRAGPRDFAFDPPPGVRRTPGGQRPHQQPPSAPMRN